MEFNQQTAIITGASRGIGRAIAELLADKGANVVINGTNEELLKSLCTQLNTERKCASYVAGDASLPETASLLIAEAKQRFGRIDILVNNAGVNLRKTTVDTSLEEWKRVIDLNLTGTFLMCQAVIPEMITQGGGKIVNMRLYDEQNTASQCLSCLRCIESRHQLFNDAFGKGALLNTAFMSTASARDRLKRI